MVLSRTSHTIIESYTDRVSVIDIWESGIVNVKLKDNVQVELEDSINQFNFLKSKYNGINKHLTLVEIGADTSITKEAREFGERPESTEITKAMAVIVKSLAHRLIINFIIKFTHHQSIKMKMFDDKQKAIDWLLTFK